MWNEPTPPSGFPRSLAIWTLDIDDLGNLLGGAGLFTCQAVPVAPKAIFLKEAKFIHTQARE